MAADTAFVLWQAELLWQTLLHGVEMGVDLSSFVIYLDKERLPLDRLLARGLELHDAQLFNGLSYAKENGQTAEGRGREFADPINHAAETMIALRSAAGSARALR